MKSECPRPRVAVITRTRDRPIMLRRAVGSVLRQSFQNWVHVIVNDGGPRLPVDLLVAEFAREYQGRVLVLHNPESIGMQNASNLAIRSSQSDYVTIHDDDDSWEPAFLERCVGHLDGLGGGSRVGGVTTHVAWVTEELNADGVIVELSRTDFFPKETITLFEMAAENLFPPISFLYRRAAHEEIGYFDEQFTVLGDWDFNLRFLAQYDIDLIKERLACYHWRHQGDGSAYGNTVTAGLSVHTEKRSKLFNHYLRKDMESGKPGLGYLMNVARPVYELSSRVEKVREQFDQTGQKISLTLSHVEHLNRITRDLARLWQLKDSVAWGAAVLAHRLAGAGQIRHLVAGLQARNRIQRFLAGLSRDSVLSLDVFDTALLRLVKRPIDVFVLMEPEVERLLGRSGACFAQARVAAERMARQRFGGGGNEEVTLRQIYEMFSQLAGVSGECADRVRELEIAYERRMCYANPAILAAYQAVRKRGGRVVFISDMYLPDDVIRDLLQRNGFAEGDLFVSASQGKTKHSGTLYRHVLDALGCAPAALFHIGDNIHSDLTQPQALGIRALHVGVADWSDVAYVDQHVSQHGTGNMDGLSSLCTGLARRRSGRARREDGRPGATNLWDKTGYEIAGPLMYSFIRWIGQKARSHGVEKLFFLSRDGYSIEQAFRKCAQKWGLGIASDYMYSSRRLLNLARIRQLDEPNLDFLLSPSPDLRVRDIGERLGLEPGLYADAVRRAGLRLDQVVTTRNGCHESPQSKEQLRSLLQGLESPILALASGERRKVLDYFKDIGFSPGPVAIVDLGWRASSIHSLQDLLNLDGGAFRLRGYYFGTWRFARPALDAGCLIDSFFFHLDQPVHRSRLIGECTEMVEHFFTAPHPTVVSLRQEGARWEPVYGGWETTPAQRSCIARMTAAALQFVDDMLDVDPALDDRPPPFAYLESVLERLLRFPRGDEAEVLGALPHRDSFGGTAPWRYLAKTPSPWRRVFNPRVLQSGYDFSYWKKGFLAQLGTAEKSRIR